jgi:hypothetical protein
MGPQWQASRSRARLEPGLFFSRSATANGRAAQRLVRRARAQPGLVQVVIGQPAERSRILERALGSPAAVRIIGPATHHFARIARSAQRFGRRFAKAPRIGACKPSKMRNAAVERDCRHAGVRPAGHRGGPRTLEPDPAKLVSKPSEARAQRARCNSAMTGNIVDTDGPVGKLVDETFGTPHIGRAGG